MEKSDILEVLEICLLVTDGADVNYLEEEGFNPTLSKVGLQLHTYLKSKGVGKNEKV